jgi:hypothetical protein
MTADICVIVPTVRRPECIREYIENAREHGFDTDRLHVVLVTEDFCDTTSQRSMLADLGVEGRVFAGRDRSAWFEERGLDEYESLIPEASHAQTSFGLLYMWDRDFEYGVFIDDDTAPHDDVDFFGTHMSNLGATESVTAASSDTDWVNVLYENAADHELYPRGYPYAAMDEAVETTTTDADDVVASQGLWTNVPDLDAVRILMDGDLEGQAQTRTEAADFESDFIVEPGNYLTVCSMNLAFKREVIPAFYQLPMDDNEWDVGRFDDIWSGLFLKRACDVLGTQVLTGDPLCEHNKAPRSTFSDLTNEVHGLELNEHLWKIVDDAGGDADSYAEVFAAIAEAMATGDFDQWENGAFLNYCGEHMREWLECLDALEPGSIEELPRAAVPADD